ncbi:MAG TPA: hypothetical protein VGG59_00795 [Acidobacteriaceae bacterium]
MGTVFRRRAEQGELPVREDYDRVIWAALSWAVGEISERDLRPRVPLKLTFASTERDPITLAGQPYFCATSRQHELLPSGTE